jgi:hypothetical protein
MKTTWQGAIRCIGAWAVAAVLTTAATAQITVKVDSTKSWAGFMNVFTTNGVYQWGSGWGLGDLRAWFAPAQSNATRVVLQLNTNLYNPADEYWNLPDGTANKFVEANFYVDVGTAFNGQDVTFVGTVETNSIPAGWSCEAFIKEFGSGYSWIGMTTEPLTTGTPFSVNRPIGPGNIAQYGFKIYGPHVAPGSTESQQAVSIVVDNEDPSVLSEPTAQRVAFGGTATFSVVATGGSPISYQWKRYNTNLANVPGKIAGATGPTLTIYNAQAEDATTYSVALTNLAGWRTPPAARLRVLSAAQLANCVDNPSFEEDYVTFGVVPEPWINFSGSALWSTTEFVFAAPKDGTNVVQIYNAGTWNGIYQDAPAAPGDVFVGQCWLYQSSFDPLTAPINEAYLEIQFRQGNANPIAIWSSKFITNSPALQDTWLLLQATNGVAAGYAQTTTTDSYYLVAPPGTDRVRCQLTLHAEGGGSGSVFVDAMRLMKKIPATVTAVRSGNDLQLSWPSQGDTDYQVVYKDDLATPNWTPIGPVIAGDGTTKTASVPIGGGNRFYRVQTK